MEHQTYQKLNTGFNENLHKPYPYLITENKINTTNKNLRDMIIDNAHIKNVVMHQIQSMTIKIEENSLALHSEFVNHKETNQFNLKKIIEQIKTIDDRIQLINHQINKTITDIDSLHGKIDTIGLVLDTIIDKSQIANNKSIADKITLINDINDITNDD